MVQFYLQLAELLVREISISVFYLHPVINAIIKKVL